MDKLKLLVIVLICLPISTPGKAANPEQLFGLFWSSWCADAVQQETSEYTRFEPDAWCEHFVDTYRVQSHCRKARFEALENNRVGMTVEGKQRYIIEFLWSTRISIMEITGEDPPVLEQIDNLGRAVQREGLQTHHLYCP